MADTNGLTIDDLARQARLPVRTIREYHTMRLLPPPEQRGYSLAGIRDLLQAWEEGTGLTSLLGVEPAQAALDETPLRLTRDEISQRVPALSGPALRQAISADLIQTDGEVFFVRSPALLALVADGVSAGVPLDGMLNLAGALRRDLASLAGMIADAIVDHLLPAVENGPNPGGLQPFLRRGRQLLLQGAASTLADQLGAALIDRTDDSERGAALRAALEQIRIRAVTDSSGQISHQAAR